MSWARTVEEKSVSGDVDAVVQAERAEKRTREADFVHALSAVRLVCGVNVRVGWMDAHRARTVAVPRVGREEGNQVV